MPIDDYPAYSYLEEFDLMMIGIRHGPFSFQDAHKIPEFRDELVKSELLIVEGTEESGKRLTSMPSIKLGYEKLALSLFKGNVLYLEEGENYISIGAKYGIHPDLFCLYVSLGEIGKIIEKGSETPDDFFESVARQFIRMSIFPGITEKQTNSSLKYVLPMLDLLHCEPKTLRQVYKIFVPYFAAVRDYEIYCPKTRNACEEHNGRKTAIIGGKHAEPLARYLRGHLEVLESWQDFIEKQDEGTKRAIRSIEQLVSQAL